MVGRRLSVPVGIQVCTGNVGRAGGLEANVGSKWNVDALQP